MSPPRAGGRDEYGGGGGGGGAMGRTETAPDGCGSGSDGGVLMFYGMPEGKFNCDKVFNLCCLYGNVIRVGPLPYIVGLLGMLIRKFKSSFLKRNCYNLKLFIFEKVRPGR